MIGFSWRLLKNNYFHVLSFIRQKKIESRYNKKMLIFEA